MVDSPVTPQPVCSVCDELWTQHHACGEDVGNPTFLATLVYMRDLHRKKAAGYSGTGVADTWANFREAEGWGLTAAQGCEMRLGDKFRRLRNIRSNPDNEQLGETIFDTLVDLASYAIIDLCLLHEEAEVDLPDHPAYRERGLL